ncbi:hypothetical protein FFK22_002220 [Mycobacterium sp. KBS0706]|uniref:hypothetical protein n=1 Tax=Mycobacterium sp. KBS0706 TaxID=2578109 RepID=UPI00110F8008|nr:hypothetical protein [Mycobacterium sp. KBS0706]TSD90289.1 hypothetical protein FFK22_002220 [Mycobacterium sp. KBS0706]
MTDPLKRYWPGAKYSPGDLVEHNGRTWIALLDTGFPPGSGSGHWVLAPPPRRARRAVAAVPPSAPSPRPAPAQAPRTPFPPQAEGEARAKALMADAVRKAQASTDTDDGRVYTFNGKVVGTLAATIRAAYVAADAEARERDQRLADELDDLRRRIETRPG